MTDWTIVTRSLRARLFSTVTTVASVGVAVALMLVLIMMRSAGREAFERGSGNVHLLVSRDASPLVSVLNGLFYAGAPAKPLMFTEYESLKKSLPVDWAVPVQLGDSYEGKWPVLATNEDFYTKFEPAEHTPWQLAQGTWFAKNFEVVVGAQAARGTGLKLGDKIYLTHGTAGSRGAGSVHVHKEYKYTVVGILKPTGTNHDRVLFTNLPSAWIIHAHDRIEREEHKGQPEHEETEAEHANEKLVTEADLIPEDRKITNIFMRVLTRPGADVGALIPVVMEQMRRDPAFAASPLTVAGPSREIARLMDIVGNIDQILFAMAVVVMVSSGVGIMLALYNSMEQRRRQIAVLRVLGASQPRIFGLILTESAMIGIFGAIAGIGGGLLGAQVAAAVMRERLGLFIDPTLPARGLVAVALGTLALACFAGVVPAVMAYRTSVAKSLRPLV
ncbi:MAG: FtsX-like permease family protein [Tepidisphaera sp.]|nr:FtsX-like permease family protein [Tepidisphaera sp.]